MLTESPIAVNCCDVPLAIDGLGGQGERRRLEAELGARGVRLYPAAANFVCAEVGDGAALAARLEREGVIVRPLGPFGAPSCVRVTVGLRDENDVFLTALDRSLQPA